MSHYSLVKLCTKVFSQEFWLNDVYRLRKCYVNIDSARSAWSNKSLMVLLYFYNINPNPTKMIGFYCPFSPLFLAINLPEVISTSRDSFDRPVWHHLKWSNLIGAAQIPAAPNFFYTVSPDPFFEGRVPNTTFDYEQITILLWTCMH